MPKIRKKKQTQESSSPFSSIKFPRSPKTEPYPDHPRPTPEECRAVRDTLLALHGFPEEFMEYRNQRLLSDRNATFENSLFSENDNGNSSKETVLDGLVSTILSQNTTGVNSRRAFASLKSAFPTWEDVLAAQSNHLEDTIRCGGLAPTKASCIKNLLNCLLKKRGKLCLDYLRHLSVDEVKEELSQFKGIGPKTDSCSFSTTPEALWRCSEEDEDLWSFCTTPKPSWRCSSPCQDAIVRLCDALLKAGIILPFT